MKTIAVIAGPNLNMLGVREPEIYGTMSYKELTQKIREYALTHGFKTEFFQSNHEGEIIDYIHSLVDTDYVGVIINPGALAHYSYVLYDAIKCVPMPFVEVHLSNIRHREPFRRRKVTAFACKKSFYGKGIGSYKEAVDFLETIV